MSSHYFLTEDKALRGVAYCTQSCRKLVNKFLRSYILIRIQPLSLSPSLSLVCLLSFSSYVSHLLPHKSTLLSSILVFDDENFTDLSRTSQTPDDSELCLCVCVYTCMHDGIWWREMSGADGGLFLLMITAAFSVSAHNAEHHAGGIRQREGDWKKVRERLRSHEK